MEIFGLEIDRKQTASYKLITSRTGFVFMTDGSSQRSDEMPCLLLEVCHSTFSPGFAYHFSAHFIVTGSATSSVIGYRVAPMFHAPANAPDLDSYSYRSNSLTCGRERICVLPPPLTPEPGHQFSGGGTNCVLPFSLLISIFSSWVSRVSSVASFSSSHCVTYCSELFGRPHIEAITILFLLNHIIESLHNGNR